MSAGPQASAMGRGLSLSALGFKLTGSYLGYQVQRLFLGPEAGARKQATFERQAARRLREGLQTLKGPLMKAGQMLSMQDHLLPRTLTAELAHLQMQAPPMHPTLARAQFKASLGDAPEKVFREFETAPFAAASLGQVHRAVTRRGEPVVVKIQYPAMAKAIRNDFKLLRSATFTGRLTGHIPRAVMDEMEQGVLAETDYLREARNLDFFREGLRGLPYVEVPRVFRELTSERVLTMSSLEGAPLEAFLARRPDASLRNLVGARLLELFLYQIYDLGAFHADPHRGNYLFTPRGRIGLVDFGCVKRLTPAFRELVACFLNRAWLRGEAEITRMMRLMWAPGVSPQDADARRIFAAEVDLLSRAFPSGGGARQVAFASRELFDLGLRMRTDTLLAKLAQPEFVFYSRAELGLYNYLRQLGAELDTNEILRARVEGAGVPASGTLSAPPQRERGKA